MGVGGRSSTFSTVPTEEKEGGVGVVTVFSSESVNGPDAMLREISEMLQRQVIALGFRVQGLGYS